MNIPTANELDATPTSDILNALSRRCTRCILITECPANPDDGDPVTTYYAGRASNRSHLLMICVALLNAATSDLLSEFIERAGVNVADMPPDADPGDEDDGEDTREFVKAPRSR